MFPQMVGALVVSLAIFTVAEDTNQIQEVADGELINKHSIEKGDPERPKRTLGLGLLLGGIAHRRPYYGGYGYGLTK